MPNLRCNKTVQGTMLFSLIDVTNCPMLRSRFPLHYIKRFAWLFQICFDARASSIEGSLLGHVFNFLTSCAKKFIETSPPYKGGRTECKTLFSTSENTAALS